MDFKLSYKQFSERSILVEWPPIIDENVLHDVTCFKNHLLKHNVESIIYINSAYNSILIIYKYTIDKINDEVLRLKSAYLSRLGTPKPLARLWKIPVCYDAEFGLDLKLVSEEKRLSKLEVIALHSEAIYTVYFVGFLPGFLYLGGLDKRLNFPRKPRPRPQVKKGAVGIGGFQTGIYPNASPGGWNIIGNSPLDFFNPTIHKPCFARPGDKVKFVPIDRYLYDDLIIQVKAGVFQIESKIIDG